MISGILLAAGNSVRMGSENKLLLPVGGQPLFTKIVHAMEQSDLDEIVVVLGHDYKEMIQLCKTSRLKLAINGNHLEGQTSSIKAGMQLLNPSTNAVMICLSDMPLLETRHLNDMIKHYQEDSILRPVQYDVPGNPCMFPRRLFEQIMACTEKNGCKTVIESNKHLLKDFITEESAYFSDIDTPEEYANFVS